MFRVNTSPVAQGDNVYSGNNNIKNKDSIIYFDQLSNNNHNHLLGAF